MTQDETGLREPRTEAGLYLLDRLDGMAGYGYQTWREHILAVEAEAANPAPAGLDDIQRYSLIPDANGIEDYMELDPKGRWCLFKEVARLSEGTERE